MLNFVVDSKETKSSLAIHLNEAVAIIKKSDHADRSNIIDMLYIIKDNIKCITEFHVGPMTKILLNTTLTPTEPHREKVVINTKYEYGDVLYAYFCPGCHCSLGSWCSCHDRSIIKEDKCSLCDQYLWWPKDKIWEDK